MMHIYASANKVTIGSDNALALAYTGLLLIRLVAKSFTQIEIKTQ